MNVLGSGGVPNNDGKKHNHPIYIPLLKIHPRGWLERQGKKPVKARILQRALRADLYGLSSHHIFKRGQIHL